MGTSTAPDAGPSRRVSTRSRSARCPRTSRCETDVNRGWRRETAAPEGFRGSGYTCPSMAEGRVKLEVAAREQTGSRESRRLRRAGMIPGVFYGDGDGSRAICVPERELRRVLTGSHGLHTILDVAFEGQDATHPAILKEFQ